MEYLEIKFKLPEEYRDIIVAELSDHGYDTFLETTEGFNTYTDKSEPDLTSIREVIERYKELCSIEFETTVFPDKNWNEEWEKNFDPIVVEDKCLVKAPFHNIVKSYPLEILIQPKMAFGTGHHATTYLMLQEMMEMDFKDQSVLELGSGTGILAIAAVKLGANMVWATDINEWSINNSSDNFTLNGIDSIHLLCGQIEDLNIPHQYDIVLANINRNVLLEEIPSYLLKMSPNGSLLLSGFFEEDQHLIEACLTTNNLHVVKRNVRNNWSVLVCKIS